MGLHLEELKERLEPGARRQLPPQRLAQAHSPPAPSSPPATHSPRPKVSWARLDGAGGCKDAGVEAPCCAWGRGCASPTPFCCALQSPEVVEGHQETAGDSEAVTLGLPRPLWHKQLQVEEDFGDLLEQ